ncbi:MAG: zinc dependent phospholipase C family protein [Deltaproteobacteria bacterium]|nr:zinc dependent phospholipase C family protein [Deltaproteobacteria bacterium]
MTRLLSLMLAMAAGAALVLLVPDAAYAWGPGAHMVTGNWILQHLALLPSFVAEPLARFSGFFLHGCLSADIFIGKGSVAKKGHSHNWESGLALLARAKSARSRAYAYGYLSHLAADTVAHNVFVPSLFSLAPGNGRMAHVYLEMQADRMLSWDKALALAVFHAHGSKNTGRMLQKTLRRNAFKFRLQSGVYQGSIAVGGSALWRRSLQAVDSLLPGHVAASRLADLLETATGAVVDVLRNGETSPVFALDPVGTAALAEAVAFRTGQGFLPSGAPVDAVSLPEALRSLPVLEPAKPKVAV